MNSNEMGDKILSKVPYSKLERVGRKLNQLLFTFIYWCEDTIMGGIVWGTLKIVWGVFIVFLVLILLPGIYGNFRQMISKNSETSSETTSKVASADSESDSTDENCSVTGIELHGGVVTYVAYHPEGDPSFDYDVSSSDYIFKMIKDSNDDDKIKAIVVEVDSGGGSPVAGEEIANAIKNSKKPVIAYIRSAGASAAYWAISGADKIFASKNSDIGSIGVTSSYLTNSVKNKKDGYTYEQLNTGKFKDSGNPDKPLTEEEKALFMRDLNIIYENFIQTVASNRNLSIQKVRAIADGSTVLGEKAKELGLIDEIGGLPEVEKYVENKIGEKSVICWK